MPLNKDEIRSLLSDIENERVERTLSTDNTKKMSEAICSFANDIRNTKKPGYFLIGADDDGNLDGQTFTDEQLRSYAGLRNSGTILPPPAMMVYKESFHEGELVRTSVPLMSKTAELPLTDCSKKNGATAMPRWSKSSISSPDATPMTPAANG